MQLGANSRRAADAAAVARPRLVFIGLGWIGRNRLQAIVEADVAEIVGFADPVQEMLEAAASLAPRAALVGDLDDLLDLEPDGVVIATPSAMHSAQSIRALEEGAAVFCQKPLGRNAEEARSVVAAAEAADRLLGVDLSYRYTAAMHAIHAARRAGEFGQIFAVDAVFHNAYGPDKAWFYDRNLSGGGCLADLGVHLVDLGLWLLDFPEVEHVDAQAWRDGQRLEAAALAREAEDYVTATLSLAGGSTLRIACSWRLHAGREAVIGLQVMGREGGASFDNVGGSFYDFEAYMNRGTVRRQIAVPPDAWGGRAIVAWARGLAAGARFDPTSYKLVAVSDALDTIYRAAGTAG